MLTTGLIFLLFYMVTIEGGFLIPTRWQTFVEMIYEFVMNLVDEQIGAAGKKYFAFVFTVFTFIIYDTNKIYHIRQNKNISY